MDERKFFILIKNNEQPESTTLKSERLWIDSDRAAWVKDLESKLKWVCTDFSCLKCFVTFKRFVPLM